MLPKTLRCSNWISAVNLTKIGECLWVLLCVAKIDLIRFWIQLAVEKYHIVLHHLVDNYQECQMIALFQMLKMFATGHEFLAVNNIITVICVLFSQNSWSASQQRIGGLIFWIFKPNLRFSLLLQPWTHTPAPALTSKSYHSLWVAVFQILRCGSYCGLRTDNFQIVLIVQHPAGPGLIFRSSGKQPQA